MPFEHSPINLRVYIPLLLAALLCLSLTYIAWSARQEIIDTLQETAERDLRVRMSRLQGTLEYLVRSEQFQQVNAEITSLGTDIQLQHAMLLSEQDIVIASRSQADNGYALHEVLAETIDRDDLRNRLALIRENRQGQVWAGPDDVYLAAYPIQLYGDADGLRPTRIGILLLSRDISRLEAQADQSLLQRLTPVFIALSLFTILLGLALDRLITRRIRRIGAAAERARQGDYPQHIDITGKDEIADLARGIEVMFADIANAHRALAESERRYADAQRAGHIGTWEWTPGDNRVIWSETVEPMFGYDPGGFPGNFDGFITRVHPDDRERVLAAVHETLQARQPYTIEYRLVLPDGTERWIDAQGDAQHDAAGNPVRMFGIVRDITREKSAELALRNSEMELKLHRDHLEEMVGQRTHDLETALNEISSFSYSVSHDLRTPLRAIAGYSQILAEELGELDDDSRRNLDRIRHAAIRMGQLIDDLLNLSKVTRQTLRREPVDIAALGREVMTEIVQDHGQRTIRYECDCPARAYADPRLLRILLTNLFGNAVKYTTLKGDPYITLECTQESEETVFHVRDNGIGFDMQYADKLFKPFSRLHSDTDYQGTGIGLATAQRIVMRHGGRIWAESTPGEGTVFHFTLPDKDRPADNPHRRTSD